MFTSLFRSNNFNKLFPELMPYIKSEEEQQELATDKEFIEKYKRNSAIISTFLFELSKNYKNIEIKKLIKKYIIQLDETKLVDVILLYLGLSDEEKNDKKFFEAYDKKHGLSDKTEEELNREHEIDRRYNGLKTNKETFNDTPLDDLYFACDYPERELLNSILANKDGWIAFTSLFEERYNDNVKQLLILLNQSLINGDIINVDMMYYLGNPKFEILVYTLLSNNNLEIAKHIKTLVKNRRYDLIVNMIDSNLLGDVVFINSISDANINEKELISRLELIRVKHPINN